MLLIVVLCLLFASPLHAAVKPGECLECHDSLKGASHGPLECTACHQDIPSLPHKDKLTRPSCAGCHEKAAAAYGASVHARKMSQCKDCHTTHFPAKDRKTCSTCHSAPSHRSLPSAAKHLQNLACTACHGKGGSGTLRLTIRADRVLGLTSYRVDADKNGLVDRVEWDHLTAYLAKQPKGTYDIEKRYLIDAESHAVTRRPASCDACHTTRTLIPQALLYMPGLPQRGLALDPAIIVPSLPDIKRYSQTPHGKNKVECRDCHVSQAKVDDRICVTCHEGVYTTYKGTVHARHGTGATRCTDCHNPHTIKPYRELEARERLAICARCHTGYVEKHSWLPNTLLHFKYLECSTCHSPLSTKGMVFRLAMKDNGDEIPLSMGDLESVFGKKVDVRELIDTDGDRSVMSRELASFLLELQRGLKTSIRVNASIVVTKAHHDYSVTRKKERVCASCHSDQAPFYDSMVLVLPQRSGEAYLPVRGTILSALPTSAVIDMVLLGETKIKDEDWYRLLRAKGAERYAQVRELGFKLIDFFGVIIGVLTLLFVGIHLLLRMVFRR
jgi:predicted CXXCH cytochrome family protein